MEHLVENHMGGYYISKQEPSEIMEPCPECGDSDFVIISWEEGKKFETLMKLFSEIKVTNKSFINYYDEYSSKEALVKDLNYEYDCDRSMIEALADKKIITEGEKISLLKQINISEKKQQELLEIIPEDINNNSKKILYKKHKK